MHRGPYLYLYTEIFATYNLIVHDEETRKQRMIADLFIHMQMLGQVDNQIVLRQTGINIKKVYQSCWMEATW